MGEVAWIEGQQADLVGSPLPKALLEWKNTLPASLREVCNRIASDGGGVWLVGGTVRDALLGKKWTDLDLATTLEPQEVLEIFPRAIDTGFQFGTITVRVSDSDIHYETTTLRTESTYGDGRRPDNVDFGTSLMEDLSRRDFTINSMAIDLARNVIYDPYSGQKHLQLAILSAVGVASERLREDGLRLMRAYRFMDQGHNGVWQPDAELNQALIECSDMIDNVSPERIWSELKRILSNPNCGEILRKMRSDGMLSKILPGWDGDADLVSKLDYSGDELFACRLVILATSIPSERWRVIEHDLQALRVSNNDKKVVARLHRLLGHLPSGEQELRMYRHSVGDLVDAHLSIERTLNPDETTFVVSELENLPALLAGNSPLIDGHKLALETGLQPGIRLGRLKEWLFRIQIEDNLSEIETVIALLDSLQWKNTEPENWPRVGWP